MNMRANLLASFCAAKDSDDGNFGLLVNLRGLDIVSEEGIEISRSRLVIIDAVQPDAKEFHGEQEMLVGRAHRAVDDGVHCCSLKCCSGWNVIVWPASGLTRSVNEVTR
jgi:hypothetical protein